MAGRKKLASAEPGTEIQIVEKTPAPIAEREAAVRAAEAAIAKLADSIGYAGALDTDSLWSAVEYRQRRSVEDILAMGRGLLLIKEQTPHGEFRGHCEQRGIHYRTAARLMGVALKFSKSDSVSLLKAAGTQAKVLELAVLDDEELTALDSGESVAGITLDDVERMGASELRRAIRAARADIESKDDRAAKREREIERKTAEIAKLKRTQANATPDELATALRSELVAEAIGIEAFITASGKDVSSLRTRVQALIDHGEQTGQAHDVHIAGVFAQIERSLHVLRDEFGIEHVAVGDPAVEARMSLGKKA